MSVFFTGSMGFRPETVSRARRSLRKPRMRDGGRMINGSKFIREAGTFC